jgi:putative RNA 2'-phosphotransferase
MDAKRMVRVSKFLSRHLRHAPEDLGLTLETGGWVQVEDLLAGCARARMPLTREELTLVVEGNDKQRFSFDGAGTRIRANQGHSVEVDLQLERREPPDVLYHGTSAGAVAAILSGGLSRMGRHAVHLSTEAPTAQKVGSRHGRPVVLAVDAKAMYADGVAFTCSDNGVWLVDEVPAKYLRRA